jgi:2-polyprenyl-3-methyl-5-hydroxy-6-metoxy-1,4-benzoquinol methylase
MLGEPGDAADDYPEDVCDILANFEPYHFWHRGRNRLVISTLREVLGPLQGRSVLDVGCGTGYVLQALDAAGMLTCGLDMHLAALRYARRRTRGLIVCETATRMPFAGQFELALLCDVIEHTPDDVAVLRETRRALQPGGRVLITVPAHSFLWSVVDDVSGHKRRYSRSMLRQAMEQAGLNVKLIRYFNSLLVPMQLAQRQLLQRRPTKQDHLTILRQGLRPPPEPLNALLYFSTFADLPLSRLGVPFGSSLIAVGELA